MRLPGPRYPCEPEIPWHQRFVPGSAFDPLDDMADEDEDFETDDEDDA